MENGNNESRKRIKVRKEYPTNALFLMALQSWSKEARINEHKTAFMYRRAKESLERYVGEVTEGKDTDHLMGFGAGIIEKLNEVLNRYRDSFGEPSHEILDGIKKNHIDFDLSLRSSMRYTQKKWLDRQPSGSSLPASQNVEPAENSGASTNKSESINSSNPPPQSIQAEQPSFQLSPGGYEIKLVVDKCEGKLWNELEKKGFGSRMVKKTLKVGDFLWVATSLCDPEKELVLDTIVERKTLSDLDSSIVKKNKSTGKNVQRYTDQKRRMRESGLPRRIYLIEKGISKAEEGRLTLARETLRQAMINGQVHEKFVLKVTNSVANTARYLMLMTEALTKKFVSCTLVSSQNVQEAGSFRWELKSYQEFSEIGEKSKPLSVQEVLTRQLMIFRGVTFQKASAITQKYPSFHNAFSTFKDSSREEIIERISNVPLPHNEGKTIGMKHATMIASVFQ